MGLLHAALQGALLLFLALAEGRAAIALLRADRDRPRSRPSDIAIVISAATAGLASVALGLALRDGTSPLDAGEAVLRLGLAAAPAALAVGAGHGPARAIAVSIALVAAIAATFDLRLTDGRFPFGPAGFVLGLAIGITVPTSWLAERRTALGVAGVALVAMTVTLGLPPDGCPGCPRLALGSGGVAVQTSPIAKILLLSSVALLLARASSGRAGRERAAIARAAIIVAAACALWVAGRDLGPALVVAASAGALALLLQPPGRRRSFIGLVGVLGPYVLLAVLLLFEHVRRRSAFLVGLGDPPAQILAGWAAMAGAGPFGALLGRGYLDGVPLLDSDLALVAVVSEAGSVGAVLVLAPLLTVALAALAVARRRLAIGDADGAAIALALGIAPTLQNGVIAAGVLGLAPITGVPASYARGGAALFALGISLGILDRIARSAAMPLSSRTPLHEYLAWTLPRARPVLLALHIPIAVALLMHSAAGSLQAAPRVSSASLARAEGARILARDATTELGVFRDGAFQLGPGSPTCVVGVPAPGGRPVGGLAEQWLPVMAGERAVDGAAAVKKFIEGDRRPVSLVTTLDPRMQAIIERELSRAVGAIGEGAIVVLSPAGEVVAMACRPTPEPEGFSDPRQFRRLLDDERRPLWNRATSATYPPGSILKSLTYAAAFAAGPLTPSTLLTYPSGPACPHRAVADGAAIVSFNYCGRAAVTAKEAFIASDNALAGEAGVRIGKSALERTAREFGFWQRPLADLPSEASSLWSSSCSVRTEFDLRWLSAGQSCALVTPTGAALLALPALREDGRVPRPYLVSKLRDADGEELGLEHGMIGNIGRRAAGMLREVMIESVENGLARPAFRAGILTGGKTGTAEVGGGADTEPHGWFVGWSQGRASAAGGYAISVLLVRGGSGSRAAGSAGAIAAAWAACCGNAAR